MATEEVEEQDLSHIHWSWPEAIAANPARSLATPDLAMDYFAYSPFWDQKSNNNVLRTQRRVENPTYGHAEEKVELNAFKSGFEYIIAHSAPPDMFIIHRREVLSDGKRANPSGIYWVLEGKIYPTPSLYEVVGNRLKNAAYLLSNTFSTLSALHPPANPRTDNSWRSLPPTAPNKAKRSRSADETQEEADADANADIDMDEQAEPKPKPQDGEGGGGGGPDWNLFHALQSSTRAISDLEALAHSPAPAPATMGKPRPTGPGVGTPIPGPGGSRAGSLAPPSLRMRDSTAGAASPLASVSFGA